MPKIHIDKSILVETSPAEVYKKVYDFNNWGTWSPWLITEPGVRVDVADDGQFYEWEGDLVGSGNMTIIGEKENERIDYDLKFLKPWKSEAKVSFILKPEGNGTRLHWTMDNSLPFFMFWMKKMMTVFVGMDYDRGLKMLKNFIEDGTVHSKLEFKGISDYNGCQYVGIKTNCTLDNIGDAMKKDYEKLMGYFMDGRESHMEGNAFSIYHKWNPVGNEVIYTAAIPVSNVPTDLLEGMMVGNVPATKVHTVKHTGALYHMGNAWSSQINRVRSKKFKQNKKISPMEVYLNSPKNTEETKLEAEVLFAVK